jgi:adenosylmethionine-8-amino-7-oxononanoate aminotransferase
VRSCGLIAGAEVVQSKPENRRFEPARRAASIVRDACYSEGLIVRAIRDGFALCPPLTISISEVDDLVDRLAAGLDRAAHDLANLP